jgi:hypothetical protein
MMRVANMKRTIAMRMANVAVSRSVANWNAHLVSSRAHERAERIMKRVGLRMLNRKLADATVVWHRLQLKGKRRLGAEGIMRRVGRRIRNRELALAWHEMVLGWRRDMDADTNADRLHLEMDLETVQMKMGMLKEVCLV